MMRSRSKWGVVFAFAALSAIAQAAPPTPAMLSNACAGCHGTNGASAGLSMPSLAGQNKIAMVEAMKAFKSGDRPSTVMGRLAKAYDDAEIEAIGEYFSAQKPVVAVGQKFDVALAGKGRDLHERHCKRCHLEGGKEFDENAAVVSGQWLKYLQIQMDDYAAGRRTMSEKKAEKMKPLTRADFEAIAHYYASAGQGE